MFESHLQKVEESWYQVSHDCYCAAGEQDMTASPEFQSQFLPFYNSGDPNLPNYGGEKYIYFESKEVREDPRSVEEATNEKDPIFDDDNTPEGDNFSDDSSDSDDDD